MLKLLARTHVPSGSCTAMTTMQPFYSGVLVGTSTGHLFLVTYIKGRARSNTPDGLVEEKSAVVELTLCENQLMILRNSGLLQIYELNQGESNISTCCLRLSSEHFIDEYPKFKPLFLDKKTLLAVRGNVIYNLLNKEEQLPLPSNIFLGVTQLITSSSNLILYGDGLMLWRWMRATTTPQLQSYLLDIHKYTAIETEVTPCILHLIIHQGYLFCATNMGILMYFPESQILDPPVADGKIYPMIYPTINLTTRKLLQWDMWMIPCGGHSLELLSFNATDDAAPDMTGKIVMTFEDTSACCAVSDGLLWISTGGAGVCLLSN